MVSLCIIVWLHCSYVILITSPWTTSNCKRSALHAHKYSIYHNSNATAMIQIQISRQQIHAWKRPTSNTHTHTHTRTCMNPVFPAIGSSRNPTTTPSPQGKLVAHPLKHAVRLVCSTDLQRPSQRHSVEGDAGSGHFAATYINHCNTRHNNTTCK